MQTVLMGLASPSPYCSGRQVHIPCSAPVTASHTPAEAMQPQGVTAHDAGTPRAATYDLPLHQLLSRGICPPISNGHASQGEHRPLHILGNTACMLELVQVPVGLGICLHYVVGNAEGYVAGAGAGSTGISKWSGLKAPITSFPASQDGATAAYVHVIRKEPETLLLLGLSIAQPCLVRDWGVKCKRRSPHLPGDILPCMAWHQCTSFAFGIEHCHKGVWAHGLLHCVLQHPYPEL
jgi:hypothetical protein